MTDAKTGQVRVLVVRWVADAEAAARQVHERYGIEPWYRHEAAAPLLRNITFRGEPVEMGFREAMADLGILTLVLTQPLDPPADFAEWLAGKPDGFSHLILFTPTRDDAEAAAQTFTDLGIGTLFSSDLGQSIRNIGLDSEDLLGFTLEICGGDGSEVFPIDGSRIGVVVELGTANS